MPLFDRAISVTVGEPGTTGVLIEGADVSFEVEKSAEGKLTIGRCMIHNQLAATRNRFKAGRDVMIITAGYVESDKGQRLSCALDVFDVRIESKPPDITTVISGGDGLHTQRNKKLAVSYQGGKTVKQIIREVASAIGTTLTDPNMGQVPDATYANGFAEAGMSGDILDRLCGRIGALWSFQNGQLEIAPRNAPVTDSVVILNKERGLIGRPEKRNKVQSTYVPFVRPGWLVTSLLNPAIVPNGLVRLQAEGIDGRFRVLNVKHAGSTRGAEFYTTADIAEW